jgi:hypothetical protein
MRNFEDTLRSRHSEASISCVLADSFLPPDRMNGECRHVSFLRPNMMSPSLHLIAHSTIICHQ